MNAPSIQVAVIHENALRAAILVEGLTAAGITRIHEIATTDNLLLRLTGIDPDVVIIDLENPSRDRLEQMFQIARMVSRPVAMFVGASDEATIRAAVDAGVSAYIVDGLRKERIKPIIDMAVSRFNAFDRLQRELDSTKSRLEERKVIERAKGILMKSRGLDEEAAYALMRQTAMNEKRRMADIARSVVTTAALLGG